MIKTFQNYFLSFADKTEGFTEPKHTVKRRGGPSDPPRHKNSFFLQRLFMFAAPLLFLARERDIFFIL